MMEDKFNDDLKKEKEETLGEILDRPTELSEEQKAEIAKEGEFLKKELTATKSNLSMRQIARDGDLCIKFLEQELAITAKADEIDDDMGEILEEISVIISKPKLETAPFVAKELPQEPKKEPFERTDVFGGKKVSFEKDKCIILSVVATIILSLFVGFFVARVIVDVENFASEIEFWLLAIASSVAFCAVFTFVFGKFNGIKGILIAFYYIIEVITFPVYAIINLFKRIENAKKQKIEENEYQELLLKVMQENKKLRETYDLQVSIKRRAMDAEWEEKSDERKERIMACKREIAKCDHLSEICRESMQISRQSFCLPEQYNMTEVKYELLNRMKNMYVSDLVETIDRYEKDKESKQRFDAEQKAREEQMRVFREVSVKLDGISGQIRVSNLEAQQAQQRQIAELERIRAQNAEMMKQQKQAQEKQSEELEKISKNTKDTYRATSYVPGQMWID